jgi:interferon-induced GTP-binding protein Mx
MIAHTFERLGKLEEIKSILKNVDGDFSIPGVVVVGMQSSGKSSVLESATGLAFPRSEGMCTRVPTIVTVSRTEGDESTGVTVASDPAMTTDVHTFEATDTVAFGNAIRELTEKLSPFGHIADSPIYVSYKRPDGPTYSLTDLPGITFCSNVQSDVEEQTTQLTKKYMDNENALVLCVLPATEDFHNSKALRLAEELDPHGDRTIGVVTKVDNLPPGSDLVARMAGQGEGAISLKHGFFAVRNRTQAEIEEELAIGDVAKKEKELFESDAVLKRIPSDQCGMAKLLEKVCEEQSAAIDSYIPKLKKIATEMLLKYRKDMFALPRALTTDEQRRDFVSRKVGEIATLIRRAAEADTTVCGSREKSTKLSARVHEALKNGLAERIYDDMPNFLSETTKEELREATVDGLGHNLSNFMQSGAFRNTFVTAIEPLLGNAASDTVDEVAKCVRCCFTTVVEASLGSSGITRALADWVCEEIDTDISKRAEDAHKMVQRMANAELASTYTNNHYFSQTIDKFKEIVGFNSGQWRRMGRHGNSPDGVDDGEAYDIPKEFMEETARSFSQESNDEAALREMQITLHAYGKVVHKRFSDSVAMVIRDVLLVDMVEQLLGLLNSRIDQLIVHMTEDKGVALKRKELNRNIVGLTKALTELKEMR